jgi:hypothetical protein
MNKQNSIYPPKTPYIDVDWKLSPADQKEKDSISAIETKDVNSVDATEVVEKFPCFALNYLLKQEYKDKSIDVALSDHKAHCKQFERLISTETIALSGKRGLTMLFVGLREDDVDATRAEVKSLMEEDPLVANNMIEKWEIIQLYPPET